MEIEVIIVDNDISECAKEEVERAREKHGLIWIFNLASNWGKKKRDRYAELLTEGKTEDFAFDVVENFKGVIQDESKV